MVTQLVIFQGIMLIFFRWVFGEISANIFLSELII